MKLSEKVQNVLDGDMTGYEISKRSGVPASSIYNLKNKKADVLGLSVRKAEKIASVMYDD